MVLGGNSDLHVSHVYRIRADGHRDVFIQPLVAELRISAWTSYRWNPIHCSSSPVRATCVSLNDFLEPQSAKRQLQKRPSRPLWLVRLDDGRRVTKHLNLDDIIWKCAFPCCITWQVEDETERDRVLVAERDTRPRRIGGGGVRGSCDIPRYRHRRCGRLGGPFCSDRSPPRVGRD